MGDKNISTVIALLGNQHHHVPVVDMIAELASHGKRWPSWSRILPLIQVWLL